MINGILVTGSQGMVGSRFVELYKNKKQLLTPSIEEFDFLSPQKIDKYIKDKNISTVINFAAYTDVSAAEKERGDKKGLCWSVNVQGVRNLTRALNRSIHFIHISTDMVFSGSKKDPGPYPEKHKIEEDPLKVTWYGYTKGRGEQILNDYFKNLALIRITYPVRANCKFKLDYLRKPLKLYNEGKLYPLFADQKITLSYIDETCDHIIRLIDRRLKGVYHSCSCDMTSPFEIVKYLVEAKYRVKDAVKSTSILEYLKDTDNPLRYPIYGGLETKHSQKILDVKYSSWKEIVNKLIQQGI